MFPHAGRSTASDSAIAWPKLPRIFAIPGHHDECESFFDARVKLWRLPSSGRVSTTGAKRVRPPPFSVCDTWLSCIFSHRISIIHGFCRGQVECRRSPYCLGLPGAKCCILDSIARLENTTGRMYASRTYFAIARARFDLLGTVPDETLAWAVIDLARSTGGKGSAFPNEHDQKTLALAGQLRRSIEAVGSRLMLLEELKSTSGLIGVPNAMSSGTGS
ncbi:hypothetical protein CERZMDRAFT_92811 [Cercospora zeae-maydis SCOH1-5]|uniref:Uncharacterized protein n=1 Tax=Cercospora zeae-maydis SCOH1-5 TaxID=717836 RepID=A0A6A6FTP0_9PEZI|nr:hypothetical protein CERZMDRAFT_92811 [Cercospora zeae-maydis SCOH1-5]